MDDAVLVGVLNRVADTQKQLEASACIRVLGAGVLGKRLAANQLHRKERLRVSANAAVPHVTYSGLMDLGDAGVTELSEHFDLLLESLQHVIACKIAAQDLDRHPSFRLPLLSLVDRPHTPLPQDVDDIVAADPLG
jgi:hypothetical protein